MYKNIHILILFVIFLTSCSETVLIDPIEQDQLFIECELNPNGRIEAKVTTLGSFQNSIEYTNPLDAEIRLYTGVDIELRFEYDARKGVYFVPENNHVINPSYNYRIEAKLPNAEENVILTGSTNIPSPRILESISKPFVKDIMIGADEGKKEVKLSLQIPNGTKETPYYRLTLFRKKSNGEKELLEFVNSTSEPLAFHSMVVTKDVLINTANLNDNKFTSTFRTMTSIADQEEFEKIYYTFETLTEATYRYHVSKNKQLKADLFGSSEPVINYTNIKNGLGFIGASNGTMDSIALQ